MSNHTWTPLTSKASQSRHRAHPGDIPPESDANHNTPVDPFLLDFGTSVNVNEDLRRVIRGEIQEIDESINVIGSETKKEETLGKQLRQDLEHSYAEMGNLCRGVNDQLENVHVQSTLLAGLDATMHADLVVSSSTHPTRSVAVVSPQQDVMQPVDMTAAPNDPPFQGTSYKSLLLDWNRKLKKVTSSIKEISSDVDNLFASHHTTIEATKSIQQRLEKDSLDLVLNERIREGDRLEEDLQLAKDKLEAVKMATRKSRTDCSSNAQHLADVTKELNVLRHEEEIHRSELMQRLADDKELVLSKQAKVDEKRSEVDKVKAELEELTYHKSLLIALDDSKTVLALEQKRNEDLMRKRAELAEKAHACSHDLELTSVELEKARQLEADALKLKSENDEKHALIVVPGRVELCELTERKEKLARLIDEAEKSNRTMEMAEEEVLSSKLEMKSRLTDELAKLEGEARNLKVRMESIEKENVESKEGWKRDIEFHNSVAKNLQVAIQAKEAHLQEIRENQSARHRQSIDEATKLADYEKEKGERLVSILRGGLELFKKTEERLKKLGESIEL